METSVPHVQEQSNDYKSIWIIQETKWWIKVCLDICPDKLAFQYYQEITFRDCD